MARVFLLLAAWALTGCPPAQVSPDAGQDAAVTVSPVELCERLAAARCEVKNRCYLAFSRSDGDACGSLENSLCLAEYQTLRSSFEAEHVSVDAAQLASCEERMRSSACPPSLPPQYPLAVAQPFDDCGLTTGLLVGAVPAGELCERGVDCAPGTVCVKMNGVCRGICSTSPTEGQGCAFGCAAGLRCGADGNCAPKKQLDEACQSSAECERDLICLGNCRPRRKLNEACAFDTDRLSQCEPGLACDVVPFVSGAQGACIVPRAQFGACKFHWSCQPGLVCADIDWTGFPMSAPSGGFCRAPDGLDANCPRTRYSLSVGDQCQPGLSCGQDSGKCAVSPALGEPCTPSMQNCAGFNVSCKPSGSTDTGTCTGPVGEGQTCAFTVDATTTITVPCGSGYCDKTQQVCRPGTKPLSALCEVDGECTSNRCAVQQDRSLRCAQAC